MEASRRPGQRLAPARRAASLLPRESFVLAAILVAALAVAEWVARRTAADDADALVLAGLVLVALALRARHARRPAPWLAALLRGAAAVTARVRGMVVTPGVDLRLTPPVPAGMPPLMGAAAGLAALAATACTVYPLDPVAAREAIRSVSGVLWLLAWGTALATLSGGALFALCLGPALVHDELVRGRNRPGRRGRGVAIAVLVVVPAAVAAALLLLPAGATLLAQRACLAAVGLVLLLPGAPALPILWKRRDGVGGVRRVEWATDMLATTAVPAFALVAVTTVLFGPTGGAARAEGVAEALPLLGGVARFFCWFGTAALVAWSVLLVRTTLLGRFRDPAAPAPPSLMVTGDPPSAALRRTQRALETAGFRVRTGPERPGSPAVPVVIEGGAAAADAPAHVIRVPAERLDDGALHAALRRRHELRQRRLLVRGLERLFRGAARRRFRRGCGFWVAPHLWACLGLSRDEDELDPDLAEATFCIPTIGPAYHRVFARETLHHLHGVLAALEVDVIFVEDGVPFPRFRRVLRMAFDVHDMFGGRQRAEDRYFTGLPGVRVKFDVFDLASPPGEGGNPDYPEPDYETLGRARVMHVYRDRGAHEEPVDAPRDRKDEPLLVG